MKRFFLITLALAAFSGAGALGICLNFEPKFATASEAVQDLLQWEAESLLKDPHYAQQFIRTGPAELIYNCHGWTFAEGKRALTDGEAQRQLRSGKYMKVPWPIAGDIIIYYDQHGNMCHSGIVKATGKQGFVLIESKWGGAGRFLHVKELPKVHATYAYFRAKKGLWSYSAPKK